MMTKAQAGFPWRAVVHIEKRLNAKRAPTSSRLGPAGKFGFHLILTLECEHIAVRGLRFGRFAPKKVRCALCEPGKDRCDTCPVECGVCDDEVHCSEHCPDSFPVTHDHLDAPDGAIVDGYERCGDIWKRLKEER